MSEENRRSNIRDEVERADQALQAADALAKLGLHADAVSRAYYSVFHCLTALLMTRGLEPKTHRGAIHGFNAEFVRTGLWPSSYNRLIGGLQRARELADYDAAVRFSSEDVVAEVSDARAFSAETHSFLQREGWID